MTVGADGMEMMQMLSPKEAEESMEKAIRTLISPVIHGMWLGFACKSTRSEADALLLRHSEDLDSALEEAMTSEAENLDSWASMFSLKKGRVTARLLADGLSPDHFRPLWMRLRSLALIACLYGMDVTDASVQGEIVLCLAEADLRQVPENILINDAASIAARLMIRQVAVMSGAENEGRDSAVSLSAVRDHLMDKEQERAARKRGKEHFSARQHELQGHRLLKESSKKGSYYEQQAMREQARREFAIAGLPQRIQDVEQEMQRHHSRHQTRALLKSLLVLLVSICYHAMWLSVSVLRYVGRYSWRATAAVGRFLSPFWSDATALTRTGSGVNLDPELGLS